MPTDGTPVTVTWNGTTYYYVTNLQGDVVATLNADGTTAASYTYDAWGSILFNVGDVTSSIRTLNPLRYRGYVYDTFTGLYYLQSRYYDPAYLRFLSPDIFVSTGQGILGNNMFAYCGNNPVSRIDSGGNFWDTVLDVASLAFSVIDVVNNPDDVGAWIGLALDIVDVAVPFVGGLGEAADAVNSARKFADAAAANSASMALFGGRVASNATMVVQLLQKFYEKTKAPMNVDQLKQLITLCEQYGIKYYAKLNDLVNVINHKSWNGIPHIHIGDSRIHVAITEEAVEYIRKILGI